MFFACVHSSSVKSVQDEPTFSSCAGQYRKKIEYASSTQSATAALGMKQVMVIFVSLYSHPPPICALHQQHSKCKISPLWYLSSAHSLSITITHARTHIHTHGAAKGEAPDTVVSEQERISNLVRERHALQVSFV